MSMSLLYVYVHAASACPCCMWVSMLHMYACPCCICVSMLHSHVHAVCIYPCCVSMSPCCVSWLHDHVLQHVEYILRTHAKFREIVYKRNFPKFFLVKFCQIFTKSNFLRSRTRLFTLMQILLVLYAYHISIASAGAYSYDFLLASVGLIPAGCFRRWLPFPLFFSWTWIQIQLPMVRTRVR